MSLHTTPQRPTTLLGRTSTSKSHTSHTAKSTTLDLVTPALNVYLILASTLRSILYTLSIIALYQVTYTYQYTKLITQTIFVYSKYLSIVTSQYAWYAGKQGWKSTESLRRRLFFEFMVFILGCGNGILLVVLWPGWLLIGGVVAWAWFSR
jgi:hypothetical protein